MKQIVTLIGFCIVHFANGLGFGVYTNNLQYYAEYFNTTQQAMTNTFYIGLVLQILFCFPAIKLIQWRMDYAVISAAYLTACSYSLQYFCISNIVIVIASLVLNAIGQLFLLPTPLYLAQKWFIIEKRPVVIGIQFYTNLLGFGLGGIMSSLLSYGFINVQHILLILVIISCISFIAAVLMVKNKPAVRIEMTANVQKKHFKQLWRQKFTAYNIIMTSVFLGVSWTFLSQSKILQNQFPYGGMILNTAWILSGAFFGILMSWVVQRRLSNTGNYRNYDRTCKITLLVGIIGNFLVGLFAQFQINDFWPYLTCVILIGIGTTGFFGLAYMSLIESIYPVPALMVGTLIALFASVYSAISLAVTQLFQFVNPFFSIVLVTILPFLYYALTFQTNFKRYKFYLNQKQSKFQLLKIEDMSDPVKGEE